MSCSCRPRLYSSRSICRDEKAQNCGEEVELVTCINGIRMCTDKHSCVKSPEIQEPMECKTESYAHTAHTQTYNVCRMKFGWQANKWQVNLRHKGKDNE